MARFSAMVGVGAVRLRFVVLAVAAWALAPAAPASAGSLYDGAGPRPGPDVLYGKPTTAPQLRNSGPWEAKPILISGASAYRDGEFLYQDFIYDDHGARGTPDPNDPSAAHAFSLHNGTYTYPTAPEYLGNAADLVELRVKPLPGATAFRITLNSLADPSLVATTIALGNSTAPRELPHGANAQAPAHLFLTMHGTEAELLRARDGTPLAPAPSVQVSERRNQIDLRVSHEAWNPRRRTVRMSAGVGLWDEAAGEYLMPGTSASESEPGGAALGGSSAFFNAAFRSSEPWPEITDPTQPFAGPRWWRDSAQGAALASGDLGQFHAEVDFAKLAQGAHDDMTGEPGGVPESGPMNRILSSRFREGEGVDHSKACGNPDDCLGILTGRLQPYAIYVPPEGEPGQGYGMTLLLHSLDANYNQFADSNNQSQFGDRGPGSIVITPSGRGPDGWYYGHAGAGTFEVWADVARRYRLDPRWTSIAGYSMGGYGTYKLAAQFPDLFARGNPTVGPPSLGIWVPPAEPMEPASHTYDMLESLRHIPMLIWAGTNDELVPAPGPLEQSQRFDELGYRYTYDLYTPPADHFALAVHDQWQPAADYLGTHEVDRNPAHVSYVVNPTMDFANVGTVADHAYWLSGLRLRDPAGETPRGEVDAISRAFGEADPPAGSTEAGAGTLGPGTFGVMPFAETSKSWGAAGTAPDEDQLTLELENLKRVVVHVDRAQLSCDPELDVTTDGPAKVRLAGCGRTLSFP